MSELTPGTLVGGKYRLEAPIGKGGMASVWRATHTTLEAPVAVKLLDTYGSSRARMKKRFVREAKLAANLKHRNVVHILDYGMMEDGQPFMCMELLQGESLAERLDSETRSLTDLEVFEIGAQILSGVAAVHDAGIVHRDVKPENIFLVRDADGDYPKLLDFGISRSLADTEESRMTNTGMVVGTPLYMSPEQARGLKDIDPRTDLWSVGMILYEALTGDVPFDSENMGDILIQVATSEVPPLAELRPDLPESLIDTVMRALQKNRDARWQDARSMRTALLDGADQLASGQTVVPRPGRRPVSSKIRVGGVSGSATPWEEADTAIDAASLISSDELRLEPNAHTDGVAVNPPPGARKRAWWPAAAAVALLAIGAGGFVALGGEIRFQSAEAEDDGPPTAIASPPLDTPAPVTEEAGGTVTLEEPAPTLEPPEQEPTTPPTPDSALAGTDAPADGPTEAPEGSAEPGDEAGEEAGEQVARSDEPSRRRRTGRRHGREAAAVPTPTPLPAADPTPEPTSDGTGGTGRRGGFVRDLDY